MNKNLKWQITNVVVLMLLVAGSRLSLAQTVPLSSMSTTLPDHDLRQDAPRTLDTPVAPPLLTTLTDWQERRAHLKEQILHAAGLLPLPEKIPLNARIFGKINREGYSIEKVELQTRPGFFLGGNLYRPVGRKEKKFPGILTAHGHWARGRLHDDELGSIPARCINLARLGYVVFAYDMTGYNDTGLGLNHRGFAVNNPRAALWGISVFGLQTWNSIRSLDFLLSLPDVDKARIGMTGASGGGTQTFALTAIDDRVHVSAPVNMISLHMQGGCVCENAPGLRLDTSNVEIGAMMAPKPLLMVAATGDWTKDTPTKEGPATQQVYRLLGATEKLHWVQMKASHNYNKQSREAVYEFFGQWLRPDATSFKEQPYGSENDENLRVYPDGKAPAGTLNEKELIDALIQERQEQWQNNLPNNSRQLSAFRKTFGAALKHSLGVEMPLPGEVISLSNAQNNEGQKVVFGRAGRGDRIESMFYGNGKRAATLIVGDEASNTLNTALLKSGRVVLHLRPFRFQTPRDARANFFTTYNRTELGNRVQDVLTAVAYLKQRGHGQIELVGIGRAGLATLLARAFAPQVARTVCDVDGLNTSSDDSFLTDLWQPGLRRAGDFRTAGILAAPSPLCLHNTQTQFDAEPIINAYRAANSLSRLKVSTQRAEDATIVEWLRR